MKPTAGKTSLSVIFVTNYMIRMIRMNICKNTRKNNVSIVKKSSNKKLSSITKKTVMQNIKSANSANSYRKKVNMIIILICVEVELKCVHFVKEMLYLEVKIFNINLISKEFQTHIMTCKGEPKKKKEKKKQQKPHF